MLTLKIKNFKEDEIKRVQERIGRKKEGKELPEAPISHENAKDQRNGVKKTLKLKASAFKPPIKVEWIKTGVPGFDDLFEKGIPKGVSLLIAGGPGSGKTIFALQVLEKCIPNLSFLQIFLQNSKNVGEVKIKITSS